MNTAVHKQHCQEQATDMVRFPQVADMGDFDAVESRSTHERLHLYSESLYWKYTLRRMYVITGIPVVFTDETIKYYAIN